LVKETSLEDGLTLLAQHKS